MAYVLPAWVCGTTVSIEIGLPVCRTEILSGIRHAWWLRTTTLPLTVSHRPLAVAKKSLFRVVFQNLQTGFSRRKFDFYPLTPRHLEEHPLC